MTSRASSSRPAASRKSPGLQGSTRTSGRAPPLLHLAQETFGGYISLEWRRTWRTLRALARSRARGRHVLHALFREPQADVVAVCHNSPATSRRQDILRHRGPAGLQRGETRRRPRDAAGRRCRARQALHDAGRRPLRDEPDTRKVDRILEGCADGRTVLMRTSGADSHPRVYRAAGIRGRGEGRRRWSPRHRRRRQDVELRGLGGAASERDEMVFIPDPTGRHLCQRARASRGRSRTATCSRRPHALIEGMLARRAIARPSLRLHPRRYSSRGAASARRQEAYDAGLSGMDSRSWFIVRGRVYLRRRNRTAVLAGR